MRENARRVRIAYVYAKEGRLCRAVWPAASRESRHRCAPKLECGNHVFEVPVGVQNGRADARGSNRHRQGVRHLEVTPPSAIISGVASARFHSRFHCPSKTALLWPPFLLPAIAERGGRHSFRHAGWVGFRCD